MITVRNCVRHVFYSPAITVREQSVHLLLVCHYSLKQEEERKLIFILESYKNIGSEIKEN